MFPARVHKTHTWRDNWNDVIRYVIFPDPVMKELMCLPVDCSITQFRDKYFIRGKDTTNELLTDEKVRIVWSDIESRYTGNMNVRQLFKTITIFIKDDVLYNATNDRLQNRHDQIVERLTELLTYERYVCNLRFTYEGDFDLATRTPGYTVHCVQFSYKTTT